MRRPSLSPVAYRRLTALALLLLVAIVVTGAAVRLTGSGLGCSDWPACEQDRFVPAWSFSPWIEFGNRLVTGVVSAAVAAAVLGALVRAPRRRDLVWLALGLVAGVIGQIVLGGLLVKADLDPRFTSGHFLLSMLLVADAVWLHHRAGLPERVPVEPASRRGTGVAVAVAVLASVVLATGAVVTGSGPHGGDDHAARFPLALEDVTRIHSGAVWLLIATVLLAVFTFARRGPAVAAQRARWLFVLLLGQGAVGYVQYFTGVPPALVAVHVLGATVGWALALQLLFDVVDAPRDVPVDVRGPGPTAVPVLSGG